MNKYEASWFCHGEWRHLSITILAESEEQVRDYVGANYTEEQYRSRPYQPSGKPPEDSLKIEYQGSITFPYEV